MGDLIMKFYKRRRSVYWSNTKMFSWILPDAPPLTFDMLREQISTGIDRTPKLERAIDTLQDIVMFPLDLGHSIHIHIKNSKGKTHILDGGLEKGQWYDLVYRIPVCLFTELEKFIEQEKGLETHEWEKTLVFNEEWAVKPENESYGKLVPQAVAAIEQDVIYKWWKANKDREYTTPEAEWKYEAEEQEMLIRLVKIYRSLWT